MDCLTAILTTTLTIDRTNGCDMGQESRKRSAANKTPIYWMIK